MWSRMDDITDIEQAAQPEAAGTIITSGLGCLLLRYAQLVSGGTFVW
jgi:hypothetical protein